MELGGPALARGAPSPWAPAFVARTITSTEQAGAALGATATLTRRTLPEAVARTVALATATGLRPPATLDDGGDLVRLVSDVDGLLARCDPALLAADLPALGAALAPATRGALPRLLAPDHERPLPGGPRPAAGVVVRRPAGRRRPGGRGRRGRPRSWPSGGSGR